MSQKIELFIVIAVISSNPIQFLVNFRSNNELSAVARVTGEIGRNRKMICTCKNVQVTEGFSVKSMSSVSIAKVLAKLAYEVRSKRQQLT